MKRLIHFYLVFFACLSVTSCEEDDSELMFTTQVCAPGTNVKIDYYSPDPAHVDRMYWITANNNTSELIIKCSNASNLSITALSDALPDDYDPDVTVEGIVDGDTFTSPNGYWSVTLVDDNTLRFVFDKVKESNPHYENGAVGSSLTIVAPSPKGKLQTGISILRLLYSSDPIN